MTHGQQSKPSLDPLASVTKELVTTLNVSPVVSCAPACACPGLLWCEAPAASVGRSAHS